MLRSEAARYARWSAAIALLLAGATLMVYLKRGWTSHIERRNAPPATPVDVSRQSAGITFKKFDENNRIIFTVDASKSTDFKGEDATLLEDVKITIFGKAGDRNDVIHTKSCRYSKANGGITCSGDVQLDLLSAVDARRVEKAPWLAKAVATRVETRGVTFERSTGIARTDQRVVFNFPNGSGEAIGMQYNSDEGEVRLLKEVGLQLLQPAPSTAKNKATSPAPESAASQEVHVSGSSLDFARDTRLMRLHGPAFAETPAERLTAGEISLALDEDFRAQRLVASAPTGGIRPQLASRGASGQMKLEADTLTAHFAPDGSVSQVVASGAVHGLRGAATSSPEEDEISADTGTLDLWPRLNQPKELNLSGNVWLRSNFKQSGEARALQTSAFRMEFGAGKPHEDARPAKAETLAPGILEWTDAGGNGPAVRTRLQADKLQVDFADQGKARRLQATGSVHTERRVAGRAVQTADARSGEVQLAAAGGWSQMDLQGDVKLKEGDRAGQADRATFVRAAQTAVLSDHAVARDSTTETRAARITFSQTTGDISADGGVRSTDFSAKAGAVQLAPAPAIISADTLQANSQTGRALYTGHARLWQGDSVLEANSIELLRESRVLNAKGNVRAVFPQASSQSSARPTEATESGPRAINASAPVSPKKPQFWHAEAGTLTYRDKESQAHLEQNVVVESGDRKMLGPVLDLYFTRATDALGNPVGPQQISRALGTGGVTVELGGRKAVADRGEYTAASGKFVMSGGSPTIYDGSAGSTTGLQLTFFLADDTIIVDSEAGSRTLTKHRVEK